MRALVLLAALAIAAPASPAAAQGGVQMYECVAQTRLVGREEASASAPQAKWPDGRLREMEKGASGYAGLATGEALPEWLELFATPRGHGNTYLGFYRLSDLACAKLEQ